MRARAGLALAVLLIGLAGSLVLRWLARPGPVAALVSPPAPGTSASGEPELAVAPAPAASQPEPARAPGADPAPKVFEPAPAEPRHARLRLVRRPDGDPLTGVEVAVTDRVTGHRHVEGPDAGGHVHLPWLVEANGRELAVEASGHEPAFTALPLGGDLRRPVEVELWPATGVFGRVVIDGEPAPGRRVVGWAAEIPTPAHHTQVVPHPQLDLPLAAWPVAASGPTDDEGRFWIPPPPRPVVGELWLWADEDGLTSDLRRVALGGEPAREDVGDVALHAELVTRGVVLDGHGDALPAARVLALLPVTGAPVVDQMETGADGRFALRAPIDPTGAVGGPCLHVERLGWDMAPPLDGLRLVLGGLTAGPESSALVALGYVDPDTGTSPTFPLAAGSAPSGAAVAWSHVPALCVEPGSTGVVLHMERHGPIEVIVLHAHAGTPIEGASVRARYSYRTPSDFGAVTDAAGRATLEVAPRSTHSRLQVSAAGFESANVGWDYGWWLRNRDDAYPVRLRPERPPPPAPEEQGRTVRVVGRLEGPWRGAERTRVDAHAIRGDTGYVLASRPAARDVPLEGARFELLWRGALPGERLLLGAWSGDAALPRAGATWGLAGPLEPDEAGEREIVLELVDAVPFEIRLAGLHAEARHATSILVALLPGLPPIHRARVPVPAGASGTRVVEVLVPVGGEVRASLASRFPGFDEVPSAWVEALVHAWPSGLELAAEPWLEVQGAVVGVPAHEAAGLAVAAVRLDGGQRLSLTDADGTFRIEGLRAGPHALIVYAPDETVDEVPRGLGPPTRVLARVPIELAGSIDGIELAIGGER